MRFMPLPSPCHDAHVPVQGAVVVLLPFADVPSRSPLVEGSCLMDDEMQRAARMVHTDAARRFVIARSLLRVLLADRLGMPPREVPITLDAGGRPGLPSGSGRVDFSVSHCEDGVAIALTNQGRVGVDLETTRTTLPLYADVAAMSFSEVEQTWMNSVDGTSRTARFLDLWVLKEAHIKVGSCGLRRCMGGVSFDPGQTDPPTPSIASSPATRLRYCLRRPAPGWHLGLALHAPFHGVSAGWIACDHDGAPCFSTTFTTHWDWQSSAAEITP